MATQLAKNHGPPMMDITYTIEGPKDREVQSRSVNGEPEETGTEKQAEKAFPFLKLPSEIRNAIYGHVLADYEAVPGERDLLHGQPPITRVNRQTRAETLPGYYRTVSVFLIETDSWTDWIGYVKKALDAFTGGPLGLSSAQSSLRHLDFMMLDFLAKGAVRNSDLHIEVDFSVAPVDPLENHGSAENDPSEIVAVGLPTMDWTDEVAVRAACDEAATRLEDILTKRLAQAEEQEELEELEENEEHEEHEEHGEHEEHEEHEGHEGHEGHEHEEREAVQRIANMTPEVLRAAVGAMCLFILACPHLKNVTIYDTSRAWARA